MKKLFIIFSAIFLFGCSSDAPEDIKGKISEYKNEISDINEKISVLEEKLKSDSAYQDEGRATVVRIKELSPETFNHYVELSGKVEAVEEVFVSPEISGKIDEIMVKEGDRVRKDQLLMKLNTDVTEKSIREIKTNLDLLTRLYEKQKNLWDQNIGSEVQYLQAKSNKESSEARLASLEEQLKMAYVRAPFHGIIENVGVKAGEIAMPGAPNIHLVNLKDLMIKSNLSESYLNDIQEGEQVEVTFPAYPGMNKIIPINRVGSVIDNLSRTFEIELLLKNPDEKIKPNQLVSLKIRDYYTDEALVVPSIIIKQDASGHYIYQLSGSGTSVIAEKVYVVPGRSSGDQTMISEGLEPGMKIIVEGYNLVVGGSRVNVLSE